MGLDIVSFMVFFFLKFLVWRELKVKNILKRVSDFNYKFLKCINLGMKGEKRFKFKF